MARDNEPGAPGFGKGKTSGSGKASPYRSQRADVGINWRDVDSETLCEFANAVTNHGDAALIGKSLDGGVLVLTICAGSERIKYYARTGAEMTKHMSDILVALFERSSH